MTDAIRLDLNNCLTNDPCALCGARTEPDGWDFFLGNSWELVCDACAKQHAPGLYLHKHWGKQREGGE